jgi:multisubunit Na+/H+ antiporter MnhC subunit
MGWYDGAMSPRIAPAATAIVIGVITASVMLAALAETPRRYIQPVALSISRD